MNKFFKILTGIITGGLVILSLGGFESSKENPKKEESSQPNRPKRPCLDDNGPDMTDEDWPGCDEKPQNSKKAVIDDINKVQNTFAKIRNIFDFIINIVSCFANLFSNNNQIRPQYQQSSTMIIL